MTFCRLAQYFRQLESTPSRLEMTRILAKLFKEAGPQEIDQVCYLSLGRLGPKYATVEFNLAEKMMFRVLTQAHQAQEGQIKKLYQRQGDLGEVVYQLSQKCQKPNVRSQMSVRDIYRQLLAIAQDSGQGSQDRKVSALAKLFRQVDPLSAKYLARIPVGKLRLGFSDMTILDGLSWLVAGDKSLHPDLESAYNVAADVGFIAKKVKTAFSSGGQPAVLKTLKSLKIQLGIPVAPELCQRLKSFEEIIAKMGTVACEPKYDGTRLQIHFDKPSKLIKTFTRNLEENSYMFPELTSASFQICAKKIILDCEAVGVDPQTGKWLPFQLTITRKRKHQVSDQLAKVPLKFMVFDILYLDGQDLHHLPLKARRQTLEQVLKNGKILQLAPQTVTHQPEVCRRLHHRYLEQGLEGVIVKRWDSPYVPGRKGWNWIKMKQVETAAAGLADTLDCVVMGYYRGRGKRAAFGLGAFLVGIRAHKTLDQDTSQLRAQNYLTISKIGTGLTDDQFKELYSRLEKLATKNQPWEYQVPKNLIPDVWVRPSLVVEIAADNLTRSPVHTAGLALRFPRLLKFRDDKTPAQATTLKEVNRLYQLQQ